MRKAVIAIRTDKHDKITTNGPIFEFCFVSSQITKKPSLIFEKNNFCRKSENANAKGHLKVCPAKEIPIKIVSLEGGSLKDIK